MGYIPTRRCGMNEGKTRRRYDRAFKEGAVRLVIEGGQTLGRHGPGSGDHREHAPATEEGIFGGSGACVPREGPDEARGRGALPTQETDRGSGTGTGDLKKSLGYLLQTPQMKYRFMERYGSSFTVKKMGRCWASTGAAIIRIGKDRRARGRGRTRS